MIFSAEETQKIETYPDEVKKVFSPKSDIHRSSLDRRLDKIFDRYILSVNDQELELNMSECWSLAENRLQELEVPKQKRKDVKQTFDNMDESEAKSTPLQSSCPHGNSSTKQNQAIGKTWKRAFVETLRSGFFSCQYYRNQSTFTYIPVELKSYMSMLQDLKNIISEIKGDDLACFLAKSKMENLLVSKINYEFEKLHHGKKIGWKEFGIGNRQKIDLIFHSGERNKHNDPPRKVYAGLEFKQYLTHDAVDPFDNPKIKGFRKDIEKLRKFKSKYPDAETFFILFLVDYKSSKVDLTFKYNYDYNRKFSDLRKFTDRKRIIKDYLSEVWQVQKEEIVESEIGTYLQTNVSMISIVIPISEKKLPVEIRTLKPSKKRIKK